MADNNDNPRSKLNSTDISFSDEILKLAQCLMPEPPTAKVKRIVANIAGAGIDRQLHELGWKAYDTVIGAANNTTNRVFTSPAIGQVLGGAIDMMLRYQRFNAALAGAFFSALWPAVGLPSATEVEAIRGEVRAMRDEIRDAVAERASHRRPRVDRQPASRREIRPPNQRRRAHRNAREEIQRVPILGLVGMARRRSDGVD
jgi:hypothetical protein